MVAQWTQSDVRPLRRLSPPALFLLALGGNGRMRLAIERELDLRRREGSDVDLAGRFRRSDLRECQTPVRRRQYE